MFFGIFTLILGSLSRILGGIAGALGLPAIVYLGLLPIGIPLLIFLALFGFGSGYFLPSLFSLKGSRKDSRGGHRNHGGGFFYGPGIGGFFSGGGGFGGGDSFGGGGGFSGGGGSFGGGGASGDW
jgi:uncharacterized protein